MKINLLGIESKSMEETNDHFEVSTKDFEIEQDMNIGDIKQTIASELSKGLMDHLNDTIVNRSVKR